MGSRRLMLPPPPRAVIPAPTQSGRVSCLQRSGCPPLFSGPAFLRGLFVSRQAGDSSRSRRSLHAGTGSAFARTGRELPWRAGCVRACPRVREKKLSWFRGVDPLRGATWRSAAFMDDLRVVFACNKVFVVLLKKEKLNV